MREKIFKNDFYWIKDLMCLSNRIKRGKIGGVSECPLVFELISYAYEIIWDILVHYIFIIGGVSEY